MAKKSFTVVLTVNVETEEPLKMGEMIMMKGRLKRAYTAEAAPPPIEHRRGPAAKVASVKVARVDVN